MWPLSSALRGGIMIPWPSLLIRHHSYPDIANHFHWEKQYVPRIFISTFMYSITAYRCYGILVLTSLIALVEWYWYIYWHLAPCADLRRPNKYNSSRRGASLALPAAGQCRKLQTPDQPALSSWEHVELAELILYRSRQSPDSVRLCRPINPRHGVFTSCWLTGGGGSAVGVSGVSNSW